MTSVDLSSFKEAVLPPTVPMVLGSDCEKVVKSLVLVVGFI